MVFEDDVSKLIKGNEKKKKMRMRTRMRSEKTNTTVNRILVKLVMKRASIHASTVDPVLLCGFKAWYMKKLSDEAKKYCRAGHAMERPFLRQFHKHSIDGLTCGYKSIAIHETPLLVASTVIEGSLDSSDGELIFTTDDGSIGTMPIELKARLAHSTFYDERHRLEANCGLQAWENGEPIYVELDAESDEFNKWIPKHKESFQLLHHVAVRNVRKGLIIIGNNKKIMFGVFVTYRRETIVAYQSLLQDLYSTEF